jgi:16S rRNA (guanine966-N2)-methyltransferase
VREAAFNLVGPVEEATVLDLFAGSGAMGLEALSRGARRCVFAESDRTACRAIAANLEKLRFTGARVECRDAIAVLREERTAGRTYDLVLCDPPYERYGELERALAEALPAVLEEDGVLVVETAAAVHPVLPLDETTSRRYGAARLTVYRQASTSAARHL